MSDETFGGRFVRRNGEIHSVYGQYIIAGELWRKRMAEGRHPDAHHDFADHGRVDEGLGQWNRNSVVCRTCGEERMVFASLADVNKTGWCIPKGASIKAFVQKWRMVSD